MKSSRMTTYILVAMVLGIAVGGVIHDQFASPATQKLFAGYISIGSTIFLRLIKMIIAPLVFSTLVVGIGHMSDAGAVGRVGGKAMLWFVSASLVSLTLGLILVNLFAAGRGVHKVVSGVSLGHRRARHDAGRLRQARVPGLGDPADGGQRDPADRRVLDLLRRRLRVDGRAGQAGAGGHRGPVAHHPARHRLCDEAGADRGVLRHGGDDLPPTAWASCSTMPSSWASSISVSCACGAC